MFHENFVSSVSCVYISIQTMIFFTIFGNRDKYVPWKDPCNHHVTNILSREDQWFSSPFDNYATNHERISVRSAKKRSVLAPLLTVKTRNPFIYRVGFFFSLAEAQKPKTFQIAAFHAKFFPDEMRGSALRDTSKKRVNLSCDILKKARKPQSIQ